VPKHTYVSAERFLLSREFFGMKLGLENITRFLDDIGTPQDRYATIHLAGTNGKGSTAAMLAAILQAQGYTTGLFTSPHLTTLRERVRVDGRMIAQRSVTAYVDRHRKELTRRKLSFFEVLAAMAFEHFARRKVDIAVIETGLGGRLDATNVLFPEVTLTTSISRDHIEILGGTLRKIAREKAGIIKSGVPHLIGMLPEAAEKVIVERCRRLAAPLYRLTSADFTANPGRNALDFRDNGWSVSDVRPALNGPHQLCNAALALKTIAILRQRGWQISKKAVRGGLASTVWPGRFEVRQQRGKPTLVFDVGHNVGGVTAFVEAFKARFPGRRTRVLTGFVKRKEHQQMFDLLAQVAQDYSIVPLATRRSVELDDLFAATNFRSVSVKRYGSLRTAYRHLSESSDPDDIVTVIGSHFLVGEFFEKYGS